MGNEESQLGVDHPGMGYPGMPGQSNIRFPPSNQAPNQQPGPRFSTPNSTARPNFLTRGPGPGMQTSSAAMSFSARGPGAGPGSGIGMQGGGSLRFPAPGTLDPRPFEAKGIPATSKSAPIPGLSAPEKPAVDLSGLSEEERRQIAMVMERASHMEEVPEAASFKANTAASTAAKYMYSEQSASMKPPMNSAPAVKSTVVNQGPAAQFQQGLSINTPAQATSHRVLPQIPTNASPRGHTDLNNPGSNLKSDRINQLPLAPPNDRQKSPKDSLQSFHNQTEVSTHLLQQLPPEGTWSRSISSDTSDDYDRTEALIQVGDRVLPAHSQPPRSPLGMIGRSQQAFEFEDMLVPKGQTSVAERCPLCREHELKIVMINGKPQPLIGQICARCSLIVCSKCGQVSGQKRPDKTPYWICSSCIDVPWSPGRGDLKLAGETVNAQPPTATEQRPTHYADPGPPQYQTLYSNHPTAQQPQLGSLQQMQLAVNQPPSQNLSVIAQPGAQLYSQQAKSSLPHAQFASNLQEIQAQSYRQDVHSYDAPPQNQQFSNAPSHMTQQSGIVQAAPVQYTTFSTFPRDDALQSAQGNLYSTTQHRLGADQFAPYAAEDSEPSDQYTDSVRRLPAQFDNWQQDAEAPAPPVSYEYEDAWEHQDRYEPTQPVWQVDRTSADQQSDPRDWENYQNAQVHLGDPQQNLSQESLVGIQEEETSDYGSQVQNSDAPTLSNSTSGHDMNHGVWVPANVSSGPADVQPNQLWYQNVQENDQRQLRRSGQVNFRSVPDKQQQSTQHNSPVQAGFPSPQAPRSVTSQERTQMTTQGSLQNAPQISQQPAQPTGNQSSTIVQNQPSVQMAGQNRQSPSTQYQQQNLRNANTGPSALPTAMQSIPKQQANQNPAGPTNNEAASAAARSQPGNETLPINTGRHAVRIIPPIAHTAWTSAPQLIVGDKAAGQTDAGKQGTTQQMQEPSVNRTQPGAANMHNLQRQQNQATMNPHRLFLRQSSREDVLHSETDDTDSLVCASTDAALDALETASQCSQISALSAATFPASGMTGAAREDRRRRRLPMLNNNEMLNGPSVTAEERAMQARELKRRLRSIFPDSRSGGPSVSEIQTIDWNAANGDPVKTDLRRRKRHKQLPVLPSENPDIQALKQQLRMLAARRGNPIDKSILPNNPLNQSNPSRVNDSQSVTGGTDQLRKPSQKSYYRSDPELFNSVLQEYRRRAEEERGGDRLGSGPTPRWGNSHGGRPDRCQSRGPEPGRQRRDPEMEDLMDRMREVRHEIVRTKQLFERSAASTLERRRNRWRSETNLAPDSRLYGEGPDQRLPYGYVDRPPDRGWPDDQYVGELHPPCPGEPFPGGPGRRYSHNGFPSEYLAMGYRRGPGSEFGPQRAFMGSGPIAESDPGYFGFGPAFQQSGELRFEPDTFGRRPAGNWYQDLFPEYETRQVMADANEDLAAFEPFDDPDHLPMGRQLIPRQQIMQSAQNTRPMSRGMNNGYALDAPLPDSRISFSQENDEPNGMVNGSGEEIDENASEHSGVALVNGETQVNGADSGKKNKKGDNKSTYTYATKRILLTRDPKDRSVSGHGLGLKVVGGKLIPNANALGAFVSKIYENGVVAMLGEVKEGDQVLEWNGVSLCNKSYEEVQETLATTDQGEVEILIRCDFNIRDVEAQVEQTRRTSHTRDQGRKGDHDSGERSPLPSGRLLSARKIVDDGEEEVYRPSNQLAPPSPGVMQRKKSTTSSGHTPVTGEILLRMTYERCTLTVQVIKARNLKAADKSGFSDPYCKLALIPSRGESKYRTKYIAQTLNPEWKETFTFQGIDPNEIHHKQIEITVWDWDRLSADDFLGEVYVDLADPTHLDGTKRWYELQDRKPGIIDIE